jgi:hypothetical protein
MNKQSKKQLLPEETNCVGLTETEVKNIDGGHRGGGGSSGRSGGSSRSGGGGQQHAHCGQSRGRDASYGGFRSGKTAFA